MSYRLLEKPMIQTGRKGCQTGSLTRLAGCQPAESAKLVDIPHLFAALNVFHDDAACSAAMNMAIDEALLEFAVVPSIRLYRWHAPALSFGYFGKFADVADYSIERDLVRRWTGGGIVFHGDDLTYSIVIPASDTVFALSSLSLYEKIHRALCEAMATNGRAAELATVAALCERR